MKTILITLLASILCVTGVLALEISVDELRDLLGGQELGSTYLFPSGGGTGTSTNPSYGNMLVGNADGTYTLTATSSLGIVSGGGSGTVTSVDLSVPTGLSIAGNPITTSGTLALTYDGGYAAVRTASTTNWNNFYDTPSTRITDGTNLTWSGNTLNATDTTYTAGGTLLDLTGTTFSVNEGTLTDTKYCTYEAGTGLQCTSEGGGSTFSSIAGINALLSGETVASSSDITDDIATHMAIVADTSTVGHLNDTDWDIFNGKQAALGYTPVNSADWTTNNSYPAACAAGEFVSTIGDTNTCSVPTNTTYAAGGTLLDLTTGTFSINEGTLTDDALCNYDTTGTQLECTITDNSANWNTAYGWGNHAVAGYSVQAYASSTYVWASDWTTHDNYPAACGAGEYVNDIDDTLTCVDATTEINSVVNGLGGTNLTCSSQNCDVTDAWWDALTDMVLTDNYIYVGNASNDPVGVAMSNDCTIDSDGLITCDHDALANFVEAEHVDWAGAGAGTIHTDNYVENVVDTFAATLGAGADGNNVDQTSLGKLEFFDAGLFLDADADGVMNISSDGTLELHSDDWDITTTGIITNTAIDDDNNAITNIDGENIKDNTIDNDSIDWGDMTDLGTDGVVTWANLASGELTSEVLIIGADVKAGTLTDTKLCTWNTANTQIVCDTAASGFDSTTVDATTWSDGANASNIWTFDVSGTNHTMTFGNGLVTLSHALTVAGTISGDVTGALTGNADTVTGFDPASGSLTLAGADAVTITTTGETNSTLPLGTKTLVATDVATLSSLTSIGTIGTGSWEATDVGVAYGGTGVSTLAIHGVLVGNAATDITALSVGTNGQILVGSTGADPVFATMDCADNLTCTLGAGTLEIDVDDSFIVNDANDTMAGVLTADGLTLGANENITLGAQTIDHNGTDFVFSDTIEVGANDVKTTNADISGNITNYFGATCGSGAYVYDIGDNGTFSCTDATTEINSVVNGLGGTNLTCSSQNCNVDDKFLKNDATDVGVGLTLTGDNSSVDTNYVPNILYNTDASPPAASGFPRGTLYIQYTP